jgi:hypothetical protein
MKKLLMVLALFYVSLNAQEFKQTTFSLSSKGFITSWLIKGSFTASEGILRTQDFLVPDGGELKNYKIDELANKISNDGKYDNNNSKWYSLYSNSYSIDFQSRFKINNKTVAYALCFIESDIDRNIIMKLGSDDGVMVFLNGKKIHDNSIYRSLSIDEDVISAKVAPGLNPLLVKVDQGTGGWEFCLRIINEDGTPANKLKIKLPCKYSTEESLKIALSSFDLNTILDKSIDNTRGDSEVNSGGKLVTTITAKAGFPIDISSLIKIKLVLLNQSSEVIDQFYDTEIPSIMNFSEKEIVYKPKDLEPGQYIIRMIVMDQNNNEILKKENIVFWN